MIKTVRPLCTSHQTEAFGPPITISVIDPFICDRCHIPMNAGLSFGIDSFPLADQDSAP